MAAVPAGSLLGIGAPLAMLSNNFARSTPCSAYSKTCVSNSSFPGVSLTVPRALERVSSKRGVRCRLPSSMGNSNSQRRATTMATTQGSNTVREIQSDGLLSKSAAPLSMTYLEGNSWLWEVLGLKILVDPVLVGNLDFGIPWLYDGAKLVLEDFQLEDLPELDYLLICQGYDDHCHEKTLGPLSRLQPNVHVIASPNAKTILSKYFKNVTYLEPITGERTTLKAKNGAEIVVRASPGPTLGPPWQRPENGYFLEAKEPKFSLYYEPHCVFEKANLEQERADVIVTPVIKQVLPAYTLVSGQEDAVKIAQWLKPKFVVTMKNGDLITKGILSKIVRTEGTTESFQELLAKKLPTVKVLQPVPGVSMDIPVTKEG